MLYSYIIWTKASQHAYEKVAVRYYGTGRFADATFMTQQSHLQIDENVKAYNNAIVKEYVGFSLPLELKWLISKFTTPEPMRGT